MSIQEKAMLVYLHLSYWTARKYDKRVSEEIDDHYQADQAGRYNKILIAREHLASIRKQVSAIRIYHYEHTVAWNDEGGRLLPATAYFDYMQKMQKYQGKFEKETTFFLSLYPTLKQEAQKRLQRLFNENDYPDTIENKFGFKLEILPIPQSADFRVSLNEDEITSIREDMEDTLQKKTQTAMQDLWNRLYKVVEHLCNRLSDPDKRFRNSLIGNIQELCHILPGLNIMNDPQLNQTVKEIETKLTQYQPSTLRTNQVIRKQTADEAEAILNRMRQYHAG